jgi:hypothetical protein
MFSTLTAHRATRDAVLATRTASLAGYTVTADSGARYGVLGPVPGDASSVYAVSPSTGMLVMVTRTGSVPVRGKGDQVRMRVAYAHDTGDAAGTLAFRPLSRDSGGVAPRVLFG